MSATKAIFTARTCASSSIQVKLRCVQPTVKSAGRSRNSSNGSSCIVVIGSSYSSSSSRISSQQQ